MNPALLLIEYLQCYPAVLQATVLTLEIQMPASCQVNTCKYQRSGFLSCNKACPYDDDDPYAFAAAIRNEMASSCRAVYFLSIWAQVTSCPLWGRD